MSIQPRACSRAARGQGRHRVEYIDPQALVQGATAPPDSGSTTESAYQSRFQPGSHIHLKTAGLQGPSAPFCSSISSSYTSISNDVSFPQPPPTSTNLAQEFPPFHHTSPTPSPDNEYNDILLTPNYYIHGKLYENDGNSVEPVTPSGRAQPGYPLNSNLEHPLTSAALGARSNAFRVHREHPMAVGLFQGWIKFNGNKFLDEDQLHAWEVLTKLSRQDILSWFESPISQFSKLDEPIQSRSDYRCMNPTCEENRDLDKMKTFRCFDPYCHGRFNKKDDLRKHMEIKNPSQQWFCGSRDCRPYGRKDKFRDHVREKHKRGLSIEDLDKHCAPNTSQKFPRNCPSCPSTSLSSFKDWFGHWTDQHCPRDPTCTTLQLPPH
ncbi:hypothetical protein GX50_05316 [[Emmonsia] crescens]|uniref:Uncharacterized protein n=1 Tax=[Emmonsia] crescens TaxID=73230 RepID=A0A2B7ZES1_9EURO|nr:hypothetical protein GX50_05316 [Emmonsia crescens]